MKTLVIAEAGVNHNGDMETAKKLIDVAAEAGADMVKFQTFQADHMVTHEAAKADYQKVSADTDESQHDMLSRLELSREMHEILIDHCRHRGIQFFSTAFDLNSLDMLAELGLNRFKIPSGEITNLPYLRQIGRYGKPVILSTGMATMEEIEAAINILVDAGSSRKLITVLHCTTDYPAEMSDVNLRAMQGMKNSLGVSVGYSDHTQGIEVAIAAVALGATIIEKHFTLNRDSSGPDHKASLMPSELKAMIDAIRNIELSMGSPTKQPALSEIKNIPIVRKSLVASRPIRAGEIYSENNIAVKRPGTGVSPMLWDDVMGSKAPRDFKENDLIEI